MFDKNDLPHELLLTTRQKTKLRNTFNNNMSTGLKLSKAQISKLADSLMKAAIPLSNNALPALGITAAPSAIDGGIQKKIHGSGTTS